MGSSASKQKDAEQRMTGAALQEKRRKALEKHGASLVSLLFVFLLHK